MYEYIKGKISTKNPAYVVIDTGGLAYRINISVNTYDHIVHQEECKLLLFLQVKEDAHNLYGFYTEDEREMFRNLITVSGIGANTAILVLSSMKTSDIRNAIISANISLLKSIKGIGPKTAQRMIVELQDIFRKSGVESVAVTSGMSNAAQEAVSALVMLGFKKTDAEKIVYKVISDHPENIKVEEIVKLSLKQL